MNLLGDSPDVLKQLADGTHPFAKRLASAKKPVVIIGTEPLQRPDGAALMANAQKLAQDIKIKSGCGPSWRVLNVLHKVASQVCINELFCIEKWYFVTKIVLTYCEKKFSSDREKLLKFKAEGREFAKFLRSLEQFIQTVKGQNNFW